MIKAVNFSITAGLPFAKQITVDLPTDRDWWTALSDFEVLSQIREEATTSAPLILDLADFIEKSFDDPDTILLDLFMTGSDTRSISSSGYYDVIVSDADTTDERAYMVSRGRVRLYSVVTAAEKAVVI